MTSAGLTPMGAPMSDMRTAAAERPVRIDGFQVWIRGGTPVEHQFVWAIDRDHWVLRDWTDGLPTLAQPCRNGCCVRYFAPGASLDESCERLATIILGLHDDESLVLMNPPRYELLVLTRSNEPPPRGGGCPPAPILAGIGICGTREMARTVLMHSLSLVAIFMAFYTRQRL